MLTNVLKEITTQATGRDMYKNRSSNSSRIKGKCNNCDKEGQRVLITGKKNKIITKGYHITEKKKEKREWLAQTITLSLILSSHSSQRTILPLQPLILCQLTQMFGSLTLKRQAIRKHMRSEYPTRKQCQHKTILQTLQETTFQGNCW